MNFRVTKARPLGLSGEQTELQNTHLGPRARFTALVGAPRPHSPVWPRPEGGGCRCSAVQGAELWFCPQRHRLPMGREMVPAKPGGSAGPSVGLSARTPLGAACLVLQNGLERASGQSRWAALSTRAQERRWAQEAQLWSRC